MLNHRGTQTLKTERLILRRFYVSDAQAMFENWANDERVTRFMSWFPHTSPKETKKLLRKWCMGYRKANMYNWAIEYEGKPIGSIGVVNINERSEVAEIGYCIGFDYWNKGIMTEAAKAIIDYLFTEVGVNRVEIRHAVKNPGSGKVAQKCGLTLEGIKKEKFKSTGGEFLDIAEYGIIRKEWQKQQALEQLPTAKVNMSGVTYIK